jgi:hypothetical protein
MALTPHLALTMVLGTCCGVNTAWAAPSADAVAIQAAYAKVVVAWRVGNLRDGLSESSVDQLGPLVIVLTDVKTGPTTELLSVPFSELVTVASGVSLTITPGTWGFLTESGERFTTEMAASVAWGKTDRSLQGEWNAPFSKVMAVVDPHLSRYAAFTVQLAYQKRQVKYQAVFLFGEDEMGRPIVLPLDQISNIPLALVRAPLGMDPLFVEPYRSNPSVTAFLKSLRPAQGCSVERLSGLCCNSTGESCGITGDTLHVNTPATQN